MEDKRIVITGMGVISPVGHSVEEAWTNVRLGHSGIGLIEQYDTSKLSSKIAGEVRGFDPVAAFGAREARRMDRVQQFALYAAQQALDDSGLAVTDDNRYDIGCIMGSGVGGIVSMLDAYQGYIDRGQHGVSPLAITQILSDSIASRISINFGLRGPNFNITTACATGNNCIGEAADQIRLGRAKAILAGGSEAAITPMAMSGFYNMKAMTHWEGDPTQASRPFDKLRSGFVASEGAAALMIEDLDHALARGAHIYAELVGYGHTSDAYHVTAPLEDGAGAAKAIERALTDAHLQPEQIDYINAHGTSTTLNDQSETRAIKSAFGDDAYRVPISSTKSTTGHMLGAAGAIEAIISILTIRDQFLPPTINLDYPDPACDLDYVPNHGRAVKVDRVMSTSAGFGGHNVVIILSRYAA